MYLLYAGGPEDTGTDKGRVLTSTVHTHTHTHTVQGEKGCASIRAHGNTSIILN